MSKPIFSDLFKFSGRRNRQSYIFLSLIQFVFLIGVAFLFGGSIAVVDVAPGLGYALMLVTAACFIGTLISAWAAGSQRIRDFGHSGVWMLLTLVPYVGWLVSLAICFVPSDAGENKYGASCIE